MKTKGFTLVEVMIVTAIIVLLAAIAIPNYIRAKENSEREESNESCAYDYFNGEHEIKEFYKMNDRLLFMWKVKGVFSYSSVKFEKIRVTFNDFYYSKPTIKFRWVRVYSGDCQDLQELIDKKVIYVVVNCNEELWGEKVGK